MPGDQLEAVPPSEKDIEVQRVKNALQAATVSLLRAKEGLQYLDQSTVDSELRGAIKDFGWISRSVQSSIQGT